MIDEGVLSDPDVSAIFGLHVWPDLDTGKVGYASGGVLASVDKFKVTVRGRQTHAGYPWQGVDPIVAAAHVVTGIQTIVSRENDARQPVVLSVGTIHGGERWNIIPGQVVLEGTVRTHDETARARVREAFHRVVTHTAEAHGATAGIEYEGLSPVLVNDEALCKRMLPALGLAAGRSGVVEVPRTMAGEDFAFYAQKVPAMFFPLGVHDPASGPAAPLHTPGFTIDERALVAGVRAMALLALEYLE
jgi:amidohydrolase